ncbi:MAG: tRNA 2-thiouridine(34) synthase MnmA [Porcipelethomonas sp.]
MKKVMVGMSGGVDSSVAAKLLMDEGYEVTGVTLKLFDGEDIDEGTRTCCSLSDVEDARSVAYRLGFDHFVFNFKEDFRRCVMTQFIDSYLKGETPNPCIECNKHIKFDKMLRRAEELGYDYIATGHYAKRIYDEKSGKYMLIRPADRSKDQTYVLYGITQYQLSKTLFPLGGLDKARVREIAEKSGLVNSRKPDSQDICFVPDGDYAKFISENSDAVISEGDFLSTSGEKIGTHKGVIHYTIGQRKGLGLSLGKPAYVTDKNAENNTVTIGDEPDLYKPEIVVYDINWISGITPENPIEVAAKTRYSQNESEAVVYPKENNSARVVFKKPQRAPAKGQAAVFYDGDVVLGGGTIK